MSACTRDGLMSGGCDVGDSQELSGEWGELLDVYEEVGL